MRTARRGIFSTSAPTTAPSSRSISGQGWIPLTGGLPRVAVHDLQVHPREGDLVLGTHGRSVFLAEAAPLRNLTTEVQGQALHAFPIKPAQGATFCFFYDFSW